MLKQIIRYTNADAIEATWAMTPEGGIPFPGYDLRAPVVWYVLPSL